MYHEDNNLLFSKMHLKNFFLIIKRENKYFYIENNRYTIFVKFFARLFIFLVVRFESIRVSSSTAGTSSLPLSLPFGVGGFALAPLVLVLAPTFAFEIFIFA